MAAKGSENGSCAGAVLAAVALVLMTAGVTAPASAQKHGDACARLAGAERVACLRNLLAETQAALSRAEREVGAVQAPRTAPAPARKQPAVAAVEPGADSLGAEQAARRAGTLAASDEAKRFSAMIVSSRRTHPNRLQMQLENGQVWRQIQSDTQIVDLPGKERIAAEIWRSGFGGYRMRLTDLGRVLKVERMR